MSPTFFPFNRLRSPDVAAADELFPMSTKSRSSLQSTNKEAGYNSKLQLVIDLQELVVSGHFGIFVEMFLASFIGLLSIQMILKSFSTMILKPARVALAPLPRLYVYDHCPYCVRVRLAFGLKNIKHDLRFLANDDIATPTSLVGKKVAPIYELPQDGLIMPESLDIIKKVDADERFGPTGLFKPLSGRKDISDWQAKVADTFRLFQRPRLGV